VSSFLAVIYKILIQKSSVLWDIMPYNQLTFNGLHGVIYQIIELFITTFMRTSNPTSMMQRFRYAVGNCSHAHEVPCFCVNQSPQKPIIAPCSQPAHPTSHYHTPFLHFKITILCTRRCGMLRSNGRNSRSVFRGPGYSSHPRDWLS
jgi:hypothetical protein